MIEAPGAPSSCLKWEMKSEELATIKDGDAKAQRGEVTLPRLHNKQMLEPGQAS